MALLAISLVTSSFLSVNFDLLTFYSVDQELQQQTCVIFSAFFILVF